MNYSMENRTIFYYTSLNILNQASDSIVGRQKLKDHKVPFKEIDVVGMEDDEKYKLNHRRRGVPYPCIEKEGNIYTVDEFIELLKWGSTNILISEFEIINKFDEKNDNTET